MPLDATAEIAVKDSQSQSDVTDWVHRFGGQIYNYLYKLTGNVHDAQDLTQETFVKAFRSHARFDPNLSPTAWLFTIAQRSAYSHFRKHKRFEEIPAEHPADTASPDNDVEKQEQKSHIWNTARRLKPRYYEVLHLRYAEDFSMSEVARILGINALHAKVVLHRARRELELELKKTGWKGEL